MIEHGLGDRGIAAITVEDVLVLVEVSENVGLEVGASCHIHDLEDRDERIVMQQGRISRYQLAKTAEQMLQPQVRPDALVEWVLVKNHA